MERVTIVLKGGIAQVKSISFVGIKVEVIDYDTDTTPVIRSYHLDEKGNMRTSTRRLK